jgi:hypothetical protein
MPNKKDEKVVQETERKKKPAKKVQTDNDVKRRAVKLVVAHLKKKVPEEEFIGKDNILSWVDEMEELLQKEEFDLAEYFQMRHKLNDVIERTFDEELRFKLRDSWYSLGKAYDKKVKRK